jgi:acetylornithine deacetylase/succinyl-diaminopimelate desuccinylase-like protein
LSGIRFVFGACAVLMAGSAPAELPGSLDDSAFRAAASRSFPEFLELLAIPNDPVRPADVQRNAAWLVRAFERRGFTARTLENGGRPLVFAEWPGAGSGKTVLFYFHLDGQPVVPSEWAQANPFQPVLKERQADGRWRPVDLRAMDDPGFDPELRIFARSAADDKGPIVMFLSAMDLLKKHHIDPAVRIKVLIDSEEETGSPGIASVVEANKEVLRADVLVLLDDPSHPSGRPTAAFGSRGVFGLTLTVHGPKAPAHSGHYGNIVPNPAFALARLLASMKDDQGRVTIPGYYATTVVSEADRKVMRAAGDDEAALRKRFGIAESEKVASTYQEALQYPSLNIRGLAAANVGEKVANVIPRDATAELEIRTTAEAGREYLTGLIREHILARGYVIVDGPPSDEDRSRHGKLASLRPVGTEILPARQPLDSRVRTWVEAALASAHGGSGQGATPVLIRALGASVPTAKITRPLDVPFVLVPTVNPDNNQHTYDENLRLGNFLSGMRSMVGLLTMPY